jgi:hypothetical protein
MVYTVKLLVNGEEALDVLCPDPLESVDTDRLVEVDATPSVVVDTEWYVGGS